MFSILIAKMALFAGNLLHRGSALPESIALKLNKNILEKITKQAVEIVEQYGKNGEFLKQLAIYIKERNK